MTDWTVPENEQITQARFDELQAEPFRRRAEAQAAAEKRRLEHEQCIQFVKDNPSPLAPTRGEDPWLNAARILRDQRGYIDIDHADSDDPWCDLVADVVEALGADGARIEW